MPDGPAPRRSRLKELLARPEAGRPLRRAVASLLAVTIVSIGVIGALLIWHLVRRGRVIRERLGPPRKIDLAGPDRQPARPDTTDGPDPT